jgi:hypothetical protein
MNNLQGFFSLPFSGQMHEIPLTRHGVYLAGDLPTGRSAGKVSWRYGEIPTAKYILRTSPAAFGGASLCPAFVLHGNACWSPEPCAVDRD